MLLSTISHRNFLLTLLIVYILGMDLASAQSSASYLETLEGEAANLTLDGQIISKPKVNTTSSAPASSNSQSTISINTATTEDGKIPRGLSFDAFLDNLKTNYIGTYFFTKRLSDTQKNEIYSFYQQNNDPQSIRSKVIQISKEN